ncbi:Nucleic acid-binding, OB-fold [Sesbania bispinosa]|nr:Nucleic acid-binding, OB-fold [Sesbania bispinosa]
MCSIVDPTKPFAIDMVLMDVEGGRIQATIRKPMMKMFSNLIAEGEVYSMMSFAMIKNVGCYRASRHEYKLLFSAKTKVYQSQSTVITVDLMGVLTVVSTEKEVETDGRKTRMMEMELADDKGRMRCTVFGNYVDTLKDFVASSVTPLPVVVAQLFKVRLYKGNVVLQNVNNTSRILWNPDIAEATEFRNSLACHGFDTEDEMGVIEGGNRVVPLSDEFLRMYPRKTVNELQITEEEGMRYFHSPCNSGFYVEGRAVVGLKAGEHPPDFMGLIGKALLFKVEKTVDYAFSYDDSFRVKKAKFQPHFLRLMGMKMRII